MSFSNKLLKKIDHIMKEAAMLENLYFQLFNLNANKIDAVIDCISLN